ncbi:MAG TPA: hypothetical protein VIU12_18585 [Chryseolinea sp.]
MKTLRKKFIYASLLVLCLTAAHPAANAQDLENIAQQKPVTFSGSASARMLFYSAKGIDDRRKPFSYVLTGSPVLSLYGMTIPFYFVYSEQERSFRQPFNQFGASPHYKWVTLHAGYRNITYSPYTMAGHTILGAGVDLTPGILRVGFIYGRLNRATAVDTTSGTYDPFQYTRRGYAAKIGVGKGSNFIDFSMLKAKDDSTSVRYSEKITSQVAPAENVVFGVSGAFSYKRVFVEGDVGFSYYTTNLGSHIKIDSIPDILKSTLGNFITINGSTEFYSAYNIAVGYRLKDLTFKVQYKRVDPDFKSMGSYFFNNDLENITISPAFSLFKKKLHFSGSIGLQRDNLQNQKESTSKRVISSANLSANITDNLGVDFTYTNFSTKQQPGRVFVADTLLITQTTGTVGITPRYILPKENVTHTFLLSWNRMNLQDLNASPRMNNDLSSVNMFFNYQIMFVPKNLTLYVNLNSAHLTMAKNETGNKGITLGGSKNLKDNKLSVGLSVAILQSFSGGQKNLLLNDGLQCSYRPSKRHTFSTNINYIGNFPSERNKESTRFSEFRGEISYAVNF